MLRINPAWKKETEEKIARANPRRGDRDHFAITLAWSQSIQWVIMELDQREIPFRVYSLGAGVKKITTDTDCCPCCKKSLK